MSIAVLEALTVRQPLIWIAANTPESVPAPFAPFHDALTAWLPAGARQARVVFRGAAKTTLIRGTVVWACRHNRTRAVLWIRATDADARGDREALERLAQLAGLAVEHDGQRRLVLVNGVPVWTRTPGSAVRGLQYVTEDGTVLRPDTIIVDDMETRDTARSAIQTDLLRDWLVADVIPTAGQANPARVLMLGTPITPTSLIARALRQEPPFTDWLPPLVVPIVDHGHPTWPALYDPDLEASTLPDVWANEYLLEPLPAGSLVFPPDRTRWCPMPTGGQVWIGCDPAGDGHDRFGIVACGLWPDGLVFVDAELWDGPVENAPDRAQTMVARLKARGLTVAGVSVEEGGDWRWAATEIRKRLSPVRVGTEAPVGSKLERALPLTGWHHRRRVFLVDELRGSPFATEFHTWTRQGFTVTGHDDGVDAGVWAAGLATQGWRVPPPAASTRD